MTEMLYGFTALQGSDKCVCVRTLTYIVVRVCLWKILACVHISGVSLVYNIQLSTFTCLVLKYYKS